MAILATGGIAPSRSARTLSCRIARHPPALRPLPVPLPRHGSAVAGKSWNALAAPLRDRVLVAGSPTASARTRASAGPSTATSTFDAEAEHLAAALAAAPGPVHLFGHSYGGAVAMQMALRWPHRVARLTLYEPTASPCLLAAAAPSASREGDPGRRSWHP
jgi:pimeloyl-ACP methyl ester carboxylesterase